MLSYVSETCILTKRDRKQMNIFKGRYIEEFWAQYMIMKKKVAEY